MSLNSQQSMTKYFLIAAALLLVACGKSELGKKGHAPDQTGLEYAPDMYHAIAPDPYSQRAYNPLFADGKNLLSPVKGTIARGKDGWYQYPYPNTNEGYDAAGIEVTNPLAASEDNLAQGKYLYTQYCIHCHGEKGNGAGLVAAGGGGKFAGVPSYIEGALVDLPDGKMFHTITYGKNLMGSHASQVQPLERWKIVHYINKLQADALVPAAAPVAATPAASASAAAAVAQK
jgi:mono/diheme cytochrome c family protein